MIRRLRGNLRGFTLLGAVLLSSLTAQAAFAGAGDVVACRAITSDAQRLACFDRTTEALEKDLTTKSSSWFNFGRGDSATPTTKEADFGKSPTPVQPNSKTEAAAAEPIPEVSQITAKVILLGDPDGKPIFTLDNGQVWRATEYTHVKLRRDGINTATITRPYFAYFLSLNGSANTIAVYRVK